MINTVGFITILPERVTLQTESPPRQSATPKMLPAASGEGDAATTAAAAAAAATAAVLGDSPKCLTISRAACFAFSLRGVLGVRRNSHLGFIVRLGRERGRECGRKYAMSSNVGFGGTRA